MTDCRWRTIVDQNHEPKDGLFCNVIVRDPIKKTTWIYDSNGIYSEGTAGPKGDNGDKGDQGPQGPAGKDGKDGIIPTIGDNGNWFLGETDTGKPSRGEQGPAGANGKDGTSGVAGFGTVSATVDNNTGTPSVEVTASGDNTAKNVSFAFHNLKGEKGDKGEAGPAGADGANGASGKDGAAATITVGTTTTGEAGTKASVTNSGTASAAVLNFTIPKGEKGDKGDAGSTGPAGTTTFAGLTDQPTDNLALKTALDAKASQAEVDSLTTTVNGKISSISAGEGISITGTDTEPVISASSENVSFTDTGWIDIGSQELGYLGDDFTTQGDDFEGFLRMRKFGKHVTVVGSLLTTRDVRDTKPGTIAIIPSDNFHTNDLKPIGEASSIIWSNYRLLIARASAFGGDTYVTLSPIFTILGNAETLPKSYSIDFQISWDTEN